MIFTYSTEIEAEARRMRAEFLRGMFRSFFSRSARPADASAQTA